MIGKSKNKIFKNNIIFKNKPFGWYPTPNLWRLQTIQIKQTDENYMKYIISVFNVRIIIFCMDNVMIFYILLSELYVIEKWIRF